MQSMFVRMRDKKNFVDNFTDGVERVKNRFVLLGGGWRMGVEWGSCVPLIFTFHTLYS